MGCKEKKKYLFNKKTHFQLVFAVKVNKMHTEKSHIGVKPKIIVNNYENSPISTIFGRNFDKLNVYNLCLKTLGSRKA